MSRWLKVRGLKPSISESELKQRFLLFGKVASVEKVLKPARDGTPERVYAFVKLEISDSNLEKCISMCSKTRWKGCRLTIRPAKARDLKKDEGPDRRSSFKRGRNESRIARGTQEKSRVGQTELGEQLIKCDVRNKVKSSSSTQLAEVLQNRKADVQHEGTSHQSTKESKREISNRKRLEAIQRKKELDSRSKLSIDPQEKCSSAQHIIFSSAEESGDGAAESGDSAEESGDSAEESGDGAEESGDSAEESGDSAEESGDGAEESGYSDSGGEMSPHKGNGIRKALFDNDSDDSDPGQFAARSQFEGREGERLFKLQQKIGIDRRFRLDERFLESESSGDTSEDSDSGSRDSISAQLHQEKSRALSIIDSILGSSTPTTLIPADSKKKRKLELFPARYDPSSVNCVDLEETVKPKRKMEVAKSPADSKQETEETALEAASQQRFFSVSTDLKSLFGSASHGFSFLDESENISSDNEGGGVAEKAEDIVKLKPKWLRRDDDDRTESEPRKEESTVARRPQLLFFFHSNDNHLTNRLDENTFYRTRPLEELEREWGERRAGMKLTLRRQHRDTAKLARKKRKFVNR